MRTFRLAILGASPCYGCAARCCKQNGHDFAVLLRGDAERRRFAAFSIDVPVRQAAGVRVERVLPYRDGRCSFLGGDDRCTIYDDRPLSCRQFECVAGYHHGGGDCAGHSLFLQRNADVLDLLETM